MPPVSRITPVSACSTPAIVRCVGGLCTFLGLASTLLAHPGGHATGDDGGIGNVGDAAVEPSHRAGHTFEFSGRLVAVGKEQAPFRQPDDSLISIPLNQLSVRDQNWIRRRRQAIRRLNLISEQELSESRDADGLEELREPPIEQDSVRGVDRPRWLAQLDSRSSDVNDVAIPEMARTFESFVTLKTIRTRWDDRFFYVESNGLPAHRMMVGITSWQQQVPLPQNYTGKNAWQIPLHPVPAKKPLSTRGQFLRGAIAIAANGVPIFNPLNNRGEDAFLFGELDEFGGHCGRADDYHYHLAPVHLQKTVGQGKPIAYALDGYPIYGYDEPDGSKVVGLDAFNGHHDAHGQYHYHATRQYPYLNGGFHGEVVQRGGQVDPQPRAEPLRPDLRPLDGAKISDFVETKPDHFLLTYEIGGREGTVSYSSDATGQVKFVFTDPRGKITTATYQSKRPPHQPPEFKGDVDRHPPRRKVRPGAPGKD